MPHIWMSHATHVNESYHTYEWVISHTWMRNVKHMNGSCHTCKWVISHIWMSHVTHMNELCHTYSASALFWHARQPYRHDVHLGVALLFNGSAAANWLPARRRCVCVYVRECVIVWPLQIGLRRSDCVCCVCVCVCGGFAASNWLPPRRRYMCVGVCVCVCVCVFCVCVCACVCVCTCVSAPLWWFCCY